MKLTKKYYILVSLISVVLLSCCTTQRQAQISDTDGLVFTNSGVDVSNLRESDKYFTVYFDVENQGSTTSHEAVLHLFGSSWIVPYPVILSSPTSPAFKAPDITTNPPTPCDFKTIEFTLPTPDVPEGIKSTYNLVGRLEYQYASNAVAQLIIYSRDEYRRRQDNGGVIDTAVELTNTNGPIKISVSGPEPMLVDKIFPGDPPYDEYTLKFIFKNTGSCVPILHAGELQSFRTIDGVILGRIRLDQDGVGFSNCFGRPSLPDFEYQGGLRWGVTQKEIILNPGLFNDFPDVKLRKGDEVTKHCTVRILRDVWGNRPEGTLTLTFELIYDYYTEQQVVVDITGEPGDRSGMADYEQEARQEFQFSPTLRNAFFYINPAAREESETEPQW